MLFWLCIVVLLVALFALGYFLGKKRRSHDLIQPPSQQTALQAVGLPLVLLDATGHIIHMNRQAGEELAVSDVEATGQPLGDLLPDAVAPLFLYSLSDPARKTPGVFLDDRRGGVPSRRESRAFVLVPRDEGYLMAICGIDPLDRELFEPPQTLDAAPPMELDQVLAVLLHAEAMNQSIGSPTKESLAAKAAKSGKSLRPDPKSPRVLIVDDNAVVRTVCGNIVKMTGFSPDFATNGSEALEKCKAATYNFVLMDMLMPEMDGDIAAKAIKSLPPPFGAVRIIAMSGTDSDEMRQKARMAGMDGFIFKPFTFEQLKSVLGCLY